MSAQYAAPDGAYRVTCYTAADLSVWESDSPRQGALVLSAGYMPDDDFSSRDYASLDAAKDDIYDHVGHNEDVFVCWASHFDAESADFICATLILGRYLFRAVVISGRTHEPH